MTENYLHLHFYTSNCTELVYTEFFHSALSSPQKATRGKTSRSYTSFGNFQWTNAVKALTIFLLKSKVELCETRMKCDFPRVLTGMRGSIAASLDYALGKEPEWLSSIFGVDGRGRLVVKRLIERVNPELRRAGPVLLGLNVRALRPEQVWVYLNDNLLRDPEQIRGLLDEVLSQWTERQTSTQLAA